MIKKKRGQVTIFIIIGLVILFSTLIILYIRSQVSPPDPVSVAKDPVEAYVTQCLDQVSTDALVLLGQQGGHINTDEYDKVSAMYDPFNSDLLSINGGRLMIPYWLYQTKYGYDKTEMPRLEKSYDGDGSIQWELESYIEDNLRTCLDEFKVFDAQAIDVVERGILDVDIMFTESEVNFMLNYPLNIYREDDVETKSDFYASVPVRLQRIYRLAKEIRDYEMDTVFLERNTMNLISIYSRIDDDYLPPMYGGLHFKPCSDYAYWLYNDVQDDVKEMLIANVPYLKIGNANHEEIIIDDPDEENRQIRQGVYDAMIHRVSELDYPFINVNLDYLESFPIELDFGNRGLLEPNSFEVDMVFSQICMFEYEFFYNLRYPVLVTLDDSESRVNNRDYIFQFPLQVILKDNFPRVRYSDVYEMAEREAYQSECEPKQRLSGNIKVNIVDYQKNGIDDVNVYFQCGPSIVYEFHDNGSIKNLTHFADKCYMGASDQGVFESRFPQCQGGGILSVSKNGYLSKTEVIGDTKAGEERIFSFSLDKVYSLDVDVKKLFVKPPSETAGPYPGIVLDDNGEVVACNIDDQPSDVQTYEQVLVRLTKTDLENGELKEPSMVFFSPVNDSEIRIAPGSYTVDIMLIRNERYVGEMTIRKDSESKTLDSGPFGGEETITYPDKDILLPTIFSGGASFNWTVTRDELESADTITFTILDEGYPKIIESVGTALDHRERCSELNYQRIRPRLS